MKKNNSPLEIARLIQSLEDNKGTKILIATHLSPDGDALGSLVGIGLIVEKYGADVRVLLPTGTPDYLSWLEIPWQSHKKLSGLVAWVPDLIITVDCGDAERAGPELASILGQGKLPSKAWSEFKSLNIDHHKGNPLFGNYNLVDIHKAATAELVGQVAKELDFPLDGLMGKALYLGIVTDTGNFSYASTNTYSHKLAGEIISKGLNVAEITSLLDNNWSIERMHLWGHLMSELNVHHEGSIAGIMVTNKLLKKFNTDKEALEGFASWMRRLKGVKATLFVREESSKQCKISLRSMGDVDVREVAASFGGGGHVAASGALIKDTPEKSYSIVLRRLIDEVGPIEPAK